MPLFFFYTGDDEMIRYITDYEAGKLLEWETVVKSGISAPVLSGLARAMVESINADMVHIVESRAEKDGVHKAEDRVKKCDVAGVTVNPVGEYLSIHYDILLSRISLKDLETLKEMGFISRSIRN